MAPCKANITLIGMPGAGKSTVGIILAKLLSFDFIDTDVLIQVAYRKPLQQIVNESGYLELRRIEEKEILKLRVKNHVIATGGSAVYSEKAMAHLKNISTIIFLRAGYDVITRRISNIAMRGLAKPQHQSFEELFDERQPLYNRYADIIVDGSNLNQEEMAARIAEKYTGQTIIPPP